MIGAVVLSGALGLGAVAFAAPEGGPQTSEPPSDDAGGNPEFERKVAELAFALYLGTELDIESGSYSCTEPPSLAVGEPIVCFTLVGTDRVVVAETELTDTPGVYEFELVSDHQLSPAEATTTTSTTTTIAGSTTTLPTPVLVTTSVALTGNDGILLAFGESINSESEDLVDNLIAAGNGLVESADYSWDGTTATVRLSVTLSPGATEDLDSAAWVITRDRALDLWSRQSPFRAAGTTIRPSLEVIVDGNRYLSDFDLTVRVADQTIAMADWVRSARRSG